MSDIDWNFMPFPNDRKIATKATMWHLNYPRRCVTHVELLMTLETQVATIIATWPNISWQTATRQDLLIQMVSDYEIVSIISNVVLTCLGIWDLRLFKTMLS